MEIIRKQNFFHLGMRLDTEPEHVILFQCLLRLQLPWREIPFQSCNPTCHCCVRTRVLLSCFSILINSPRQAYPTNLIFCFVCWISWMERSTFWIKEYNSTLLPSHSLFLSKTGCRIVSTFFCSGGCCALWELHVCYGPLSLTVTTAITLLWKKWILLQRVSVSTNNWSKLKISIVRWPDVQ